MQLLKISEIWSVGSWSAQAIFWTIAIIATLSLAIFLVYSLFSDEEDTEPTSALWIRSVFDTRTILLFLTVFGWTATIGSYFHLTFWQLVLSGTTAGVAVAGLNSLWLYRARRSYQQNDNSTNTGKVSKSIPPHRAGIGKVYLSANRQPLELDAITIGRELPVGAPVRIIDMLDDHTAVVEPIDSSPGGY